MKSPDTSGLSNEELLERQHKIERMTERLNQIDVELIKDLCAKLMKRCGMSDTMIQARFNGFDLDLIKLKTKRHINDDDRPKVVITYNPATLKLFSKDIEFNIDADYDLIFIQLLKFFLHEFCHYISTSENMSGFLYHSSKSYEALDEGVTDFLATILLLKYSGLKNIHEDIDLSYLFFQNIFLLAVKLISEITDVDEDKCLEGFVHAYFIGDQTFDAFLQSLVDEYKSDKETYDRLITVFELLAGCDVNNEEHVQSANRIMIEMARVDGKVREVFAQTDKDGKLRFNPEKISIEYHRLANVL